MFKKVGGALSFIFLTRAHREPIAAGRSLVESLKDAWSLFRSAREQTAAAQSNGPELWAQTVAWHGVTTEHVQQRVRQHQVMSALALVFGVYGCYGAIANGAVPAGLSCTVVASIFSLRAALRLYQMRAQSLCSVGEYLRVMWEHPVELLPRGLPANWRLVSQSNLPVVHS